MKTMTTEQMVQAIDWKLILPIALELIKEVLKPTKDWQRIFHLGIELVKIIMQAEQATGLAINWAKLIQLILTILSLLGQPGANSAWQDWLKKIIELILSLLAPSPPGNGATPSPDPSPDFPPLP